MPRLTFLLHLAQLGLTAPDDRDIDGSAGPMQTFSREVGLTFPKARSEMASSLQALSPQVLELHAIWLTLGMSEK